MQDTKQNNINDIIFIENIPTQAIIGINDFEKLAPQKLIVSVRLGTDITQAVQTGDIQHALNYDAISRFIDEKVQASQFELLESLADYLVQQLFANFTMTSIELTIQKPGAISYSQQVGLTIYRERP